MASRRKREALAKAQGVAVSKLVLRRPEGLSRGAGAAWKRKPALRVQPLTKMF